MWLESIYSPEWAAFLIAHWVSRKLQDGRSLMEGTTHASADWLWDGIWRYKPNVGWHHAEDFTHTPKKN
jgi:hypothetical protein